MVVRTGELPQQLQQHYLLCMTSHHEPHLSSCCIINSGIFLRDCTWETKEVRLVEASIVPLTGLHFAKLPF